MARRIFANVLEELSLRRREAARPSPRTNYVWSACTHERFSGAVRPEPLRSPPAARDILENRPNRKTRMTATEAWDHFAERGPTIERTSACAAPSVRSTLFVLCCDTSAGYTPRSIETTTLVSIQWRAANNAPDPACVGASLHVGPEDRRQNVRAPRRRKSRRPIRSEPLHARRRARRSGFGRRNRDGQLARALGGAGLRRSFLRPRVVRGISPRIRDSSLRDPLPTHPCLALRDMRAEI